MQIIGKRRHFRTYRSRCLTAAAPAALVLGALYPSAAAAQTTPQGSLQTIAPTHGNSDVSVAGISGDATTVIGDSLNAVPGGTSTSVINYRSFYWTAAGGTQDLDPSQTMTLVQPYGVDYDGSVIIGSVIDNSHIAPFRWTAATGFVDLGSQTGEAYGVNADGSVVVGYTYDPNYATEAADSRSSIGVQSLGR